MSRRGPKTTFSAEKVISARRIIESLPHSAPVISAFVTLLCAQGRLTQAEIASLAGISVATVKRLACAQLPALADSPLKASAHWGGDRRSLLPYEKATQLLEGFATEARNGNIVTVKRVKNAIEAEIGHKVTIQTIYNLLKRHHWFKKLSSEVLGGTLPTKQINFEDFATRYIWMPPKTDCAE